MYKIYYNGNECYCVTVFYILHKNYPYQINFERQKMYYLKTSKNSIYTYYEIKISKKKYRIYLLRFVTSKIAL